MSVQTLIPMTPIADVTALFAVGDRITTDWSGSVFCLSDLSLTNQALFPQSQAIATFAKGYPATTPLNSVYRNNMPMLNWNARLGRFSMFTGNTGSVPLVSLFGPSGAWLRDLMGLGVAVGSAIDNFGGGYNLPIELDSGTYARVATLIGGVSTDLFYDEAGNLAASIGRAMGTPTVQNAAYVGGNMRYWLDYQEDTIGQPVANLLLVDSAFNTLILGDYPDASPGLTTPFTGDGVFNATGIFDNFSFQSWRDNLAIGATDNYSSVGTAINAVTGFPDGTISPFPTGFVVAIGDQLALPTFPIDFTLGGLPYGYNGANGALETMLISGDNLYAIATVGVSGGQNNANVLYAGGLISLAYYRTGTLNWKRSLTYGERMPWTGLNQGLGEGGTAPIAANVVPQAGAFVRDSMLLWPIGAPTKRQPRMRR